MSPHSLSVAAPADVTELSPRQASLAMSQMATAGAKHIDISGICFEEGGAAQTEDIRVRAKKVADLMRQFGREEDAVLMDDVIAAETLDIWKQENWVSGTNACRIAVVKGQIENVRTFIRNGVDPRLPNEFNQTLLHLAASGGRMKVVKYLIDECGVDVNEECLTFTVDNTREPGGGTALTMAVRHGQEAVVKYLLKSGAEVDLLQDGQTALMIAARRGHANIVNILLQCGADEELTASGGSGADLRKTAEQMADYWGKTSVTWEFRQFHGKSGDTSTGRGASHASGIQV